MNWNILKIKSKKVIVVTAIAFLLLPSIFPNVLLYVPTAEAATGVPEIISYQGRLTDASGVLLGGAGTDYCFTFAFYDDATVGGGDVKVWPAGAPGIVTAEVTQGVFNVNIGDTANGYPDTLDYNFQDNDTVFLNVQVATQVGGACGGGDETFETLSPRQQVTAAGYAINAASVLGSVPGTGANNLLLLDGGGDINIAGDVITGGILQANTLTPTGALVLGATSQTVTLQGSVTTLTSTGAGNDIILNSADTIELQDDTNVTGDLDISGVIQAGSSNVNITLATGLLDADALGLITGDGAGLTSSGSGLETDTDRLGLLQGCGDGQVLKWTDASDIWACADDSVGGGAGTLQNSYDNGGLITTTDAKDIDIVLADTATDSNLDIDIIADNTVSISRNDGASTEAPSQLLLLENLDTNLTIAAGLALNVAAGGAITTGIDLSDAEIVTAIAVGNNDVSVGGATISATEFAILDNNIALTSEVTGILPTANGGSGLDASSAANGTLLVGNGAGFTLANLTQGSGITIGNGAGTITINSTLGTSVDLASEVTGTLPVGNGGTGATTLVDLITLGTHTSGDYVASFTAGAGLTGDAAGEGSTPTLAVGAGTAITVNANDVAVTPDAITDTQLAFNTGQHLATTSDVIFSTLTLDNDGLHLLDTNATHDLIISPGSDLTVDRTLTITTGDANRVLTLSGNADISGTNTGDVTLAGSLDYLTIAGQVITRNAIDLATDTTGTLAVASGGTGQTTYTNGQLLIGNTTGNTLTKATLTQGTGITITNGTGTIEIASTLGTSVDLTSEVTGILPVANGGTGASTLNNLITLGTHTTGDYVASFTAGAGLTGDGAGEGSTPTLAVGAGTAITVNANDVAVTADGITDTQLAFNTGQHLTTASTPSFAGLTLTAGLTISGVTTDITTATDEDLTLVANGTGTIHLNDTVTIAGVITSTNLATGAGSECLQVNSSGVISTTGDACGTSTGISSLTLAGSAGTPQSLNDGDTITIAAGAGITTTAGATDTVTIVATLGTSVDLTSEVTGILPVANGGTGASTLNNLITLGTHTTGDYVASTNTSVLTGLTGGSAGSEGAALTLGFDYSQALSGDVALAANAAVFGTSGLVFEGATADTIEAYIAIADPTVSDKTYTFSGATGTVLTTGNYTGTLDAVYVNVGESPAAGDISGSFTAGFTIDANSVALGTDTTGNYVATIADSGAGTITVNNSGTETVAVTLGITADSIGDTQLAFNTGQHLTTTSDVIFSTLTLDNTGLHLLDTNATHDLIISPGSDLSVDRTLTITTGDANRTLTLSGNADISGTNTGDQTSIVGITGTIAQFNTALTDGDFATGGGTATGTNTGDQTSVTGNAGTVTFADAGGDTTTFVALGTDATGNLSPATDTELIYNATTNTLTTTTFVGALTGNASTATALAANGANCSAGSGAGGVDASGAAEDCTDYEEDLSNSAGLLAALSDETGTGLAVFNNSPTLTSPRFADLGFLADANGNELLIFDSVASAVNELTIINAATTNGVSIAATGGDAAVALSIDAKGTGVINIGNTSTGNILLAGGSGSTGCTLTNSTGAFACTGALSGSNFSGSSSGTNTGDQTSIVGITGTIAQFNTALTDGDFATGGGTATGTNTGDQTITLTGDVTGSGTGSFAATIAAQNSAFWAGKITDETGTGLVVFNTSPSLTTPTIGAATATSITIGANTLDTNEWANLDGLNQTLATSSSPSFAGLTLTAGLTFSAVATDITTGTGEDLTIVANGAGIIHLNDSVTIASGLTVTSLGGGGVQCLQVSNTGVISGTGDACGTSTGISTLSLDGDVGTPETLNDGNTITIAGGTSIDTSVGATDTVTINVTADSITDTQLAFNTGQDLTTSSNVTFATLTLNNTGLHLLDTNATHDLIISPGSDLTVDRTLTITTGDADRTLTLSGNADISGTNTGDQTSIVGITGTIAQFNTALTDGDFATGGGTATGTNTGDQTSVTGNAGTVTFADAGGDTTTFVALGTAATGNLSPATDTELIYNATTNTLTTTTFVGALTGNASTATALAANGANCSAGSGAGGVDASGAAEDCTDYEEDLSNSAGLLAALSDETGTGLAVFNNSPTLTSPRFADLGFLADANGNELLIFDSVASAVNELTIINAATTNGVSIAATGGDAAVALSIDAKGTGVINIGNTSTGNILLAGGSGSTGCTLTNSTGAFACTGALSGSNFSGSSSGTNTGDQTSIVGITGTIAQFNTALTDGDFATGGGTATGTNTGDQTITLTGDVTGSGTGSFAATIAAQNSAFWAGKITDETGTGLVVFNTSPSLTTPTIGAATATSITIGANTLDTNEWANLDGLNQTLATSSSPSFAGLTLTAGLTFSAVATDITTGTGEDLTIVANGAGIIHLNDSVTIASGLTVTSLGGGGVQCLQVSNTGVISGTGDACGTSTGISTLSLDGDVGTPETLNDGNTITIAGGTSIDTSVGATDTVTINVTADSITDTQLAFNTGQDLTTSSNVTFATLTLNNTGLHLLDTNATHDLIISPGSDLTVDRTLTITTGDADRTLTLSGNADISGTNTGDQTSIVGITGTIAQFNTALTDGDFATGGGTATGTNTGDQTSVTGNAGTVTFADAGGDTTTFVALGTAATGNLSPATDTELIYNATTNTLTTTTFVGALTGNASTATALAANPTDCGANTFATTIAANGNLTCAAIADADVPNNITIDLATLATTLTITDNEATNETNAVLFTSGGDLDGGNLGIESDGDFNYNPSTGTVSASIFSGALSGNATTATALAANPADCGANTFATTIAANGDLTCASVNLATDTTGTLAVASGGTGQTTYTNGQLLIGNTTGNTLTKATLTQGSGITITNGTGSIEIANADAGSAQNIFKNFAVSGQSTVAADTNTDTLTFVAGTNITITTDAGAADSITINATDTTLDEATVESFIFDADAENITGVWEVQDDVNFVFGNDANWAIQYDEAVDDQLLFVTTGTTATATTDPLFEILVGTTPTADQQVFGIAKGTQATNTPLFTVDEDGDGIFNGTVTAPTFIGALSGNASTATALAANPADCGANTFATTIAANGNLTCAAIADADVPNNITIDLATLATTLTITDNEATNETNAVLFTSGGDLDGGNLGIESDGDFNYNPSTGTVSATTFSGALSGNATTATALAANPADCGANTFATTIAANGDLTCASVNLATDTTGTLAVASGGTGQTTYTNGQLLIGNTTGNTLTKATLTQGSGITITNGTGSIEIANADAGSAQNIFKNFAVSGQSTVAADTNTDTLTFVAGTNITITTDAGAADSITINATDTTLDEATVESFIFDADAENITGVWEVQDDVNFVFGNDANWAIQYDEAVDDQLLFVTTGTTATATTDPLFEILVGTTPTADQQVFGIAKGTQATNTPLFTVDEDGDGIFNGTVTAPTFIGALSGNASTATALAANPADCGANTFATTIAANGNLTCAAIADADVPNNITIDLATLATTLTITDNEATNETNAVLFTSGGDLDGGNLGIESDGDFNYNPSTGTVSATTFSGALSGNATTATALAANPADCGANTFATTIAANGDLTCASVNLATDTTGTLAVASGGTGQTTYTNGQLLIGNTTGNTLTKATLTQGSGITITNGTGSIEIANADAGSAQNIFKNFAVSGQSTVAADTNTDTLTFVAGTNITITTDAGAADSITINATDTTLDEATVESFIFDADAENITGVWEVQDDVNFVFGNDANWAIQYDEAVDDQLLFVTTGTTATATTDPLFEILVGTTPTADQQVFGIAKGTQATNTPLFTVDEDGDGIFNGTVTAPTFIGALSGNASTATALAANPADCSANQFATTIAANGNLTCAAIVDADVPNNITIDLATLATTLTITDNEATNETNAVLFTSGGDLDGGNLGIESDGDFNYNPSTGTVSASIFSGALSGNATTATALAANPADCGANTFATTIAANGDLTCANIDLSTADVTGTLTVNKGGTGTSTAFTQGSVVFAGASGVYNQNNTEFFWDNTNDRLGLGANTSLKSVLHVEGSTTASGADAIAGTYSELTLTNSTGSGFQFGNRTLVTVNGATAGTEVGELIRMTDSTSLTNTVRGLEVQAWSGTNTAGINTGIATFGKTFGIEATTDALAGGIAVPAAVFADLDNGSAPTAGNAIRAYTNNATSANLVSLYQETSAFTGAGLIMDFGNGAGSYAGNFIDLQDSGVSQFSIASDGTITSASLAGGGTLCLQTDTNGVISAAAAACGSGAGTLDAAYTGGNTIGTDSGSNIIFNLAEVATPTEFTINNLDTAGTNAVQIDNTIASGTLTNGLFIEQSGAGTMTRAIHISETAGTITDGILITGTLGNILNSTSIDITGTGAITGATGVSSTTGTFSSALAANGGITFDASTDTVGAFTAAGTINMSNNILTNIGNAGTDFVASTGALTLAGVLTANGGISMGTQALTGTTGIINYTNFDVSATGNITVAAAEGLDTNAAGALELGKANATSIDICNSAACDTINIGNLATTDADTIIIGDVLDNVSITGDQWSITDAGVLTVASCTGCGGGGITIGDTVTSGTTGSILFVGSGPVLAQNNAALFWDNSANELGIGTASPGAKLDVTGSTTGSGATAIAGILSNLTLTNGTASGFQFGNRTLVSVNGATAGTEVGEFIRMTDNTSLANTVRGLEVQAYSGTNNSGVNTGIATFGKTFGLHAETTAQAGTVAQAAAVFADLNNSGDGSLGNAIRAYSDNVTSADLVSLYQETTTFSGTGLVMNFGNNSGTFNGKFISTENTGTENFHIDSDGSTFVSFTGSATTNGVCHTGAGAANNDEIVDCSTTPGDIAEWYETESNVEAGDVVMITSQKFNFTEDLYNPFTGTQTGTQRSNTVSVLGKAAPNQGTAIGIVSTSPYQTYGEAIIENNASNPQPVALAGRVPVKVSEENGKVYAGEHISLSQLMPGYAAKMTASGQSIGIALEDSNGGTSGLDEIMVFINLGYQKIDVAFDSESETILVENNLDLDGNSLSNVASITSASGLWSIDETGILVVKEIHTEKLCIGETCVDEDTLKSLLQSGGVAGTSIGSSGDSSDDEQVSEETSGEETTTEETSTEEQPSTEEQTSGGETTEEETVTEETTTEETAQGTGTETESPEPPAEPEPEPTPTPEPEPEPAPEPEPST